MSNLIDIDEIYLAALQGARQFTSLDTFSACELDDESSLVLAFFEFLKDDVQVDQKIRLATFFHAVETVKKEFTHPNAETDIDLIDFDRENTISFEGLNPNIKPTNTPTRNPDFFEDPSAKKSQKNNDDFSSDELEEEFEVTQFHLAFCYIAQQVIAHAKTLEGIYQSNQKITSALPRFSRPIKPLSLSKPLQPDGLKKSKMRP